MLILIALIGGFMAVLAVAIAYLSGPAYIIKGGEGKSAAEQMNCQWIDGKGRPVTWYDGNKQDFGQWQPYVNDPTNKGDLAAKSVILS